MAVLRTDVLARLLLDRLLRVGPMTEAAAVMLLEDRAPGRAQEIITWASQAGMIRRTPAVGDAPATLAPAHMAPRPIAA